METQWKRCQKFVFLMMERRGYYISTSDDYMSHIFCNDANERVFVWLYKNHKMNIDAIKDFVHIIQSQKFRDSIIIYQSVITSSTRKVIENLLDFHIELFELKEFQYDMTKFKYYCVHEKVSQDNAISIKKKYGTSIPSILRSDPVARYFNFQKGDIIRVKRQNGTIIYRLVK